jgi:hypothetical protein
VTQEIEKARLERVYPRQGDSNVDSHPPYSFLLRPSAFFLYLEFFLFIHFCVAVYGSGSPESSFKSPVTPSMLGLEVEQYLHSQNASSDFVPIAGRPPIIDTVNNARASSIDEEDRFLDFVIPFVEPIVNGVSSGIVMVSSENNQWIPHYRHPYRTVFDQKPDLFFCHPINVELKLPPPAVLQFNQPLCNRLYGIVPSTSLYQDVIIGDCKVKLETRCFGEAISRGMNIVHITGSELRLVLFFRSGVWLVTMDRVGQVSSRIKMKWTDVSFFFAKKFQF